MFEQLPGRFVDAKSGQKLSREDALAKISRMFQREWRRKRTNDKFKDDQVQKEKNVAGGGDVDPMDNNPGEADKGENVDAEEDTEWIETHEKRFWK